MLAAGPRWEARFLRNLRNSSEDSGGGLCWKQFQLLNCMSQSLCIYQPCHRWEMSKTGNTRINYWGVSFLLWGDVDIDKLKIVSFSTYLEGLEQSEQLSMPVPCARLQYTDVYTCCNWRRTNFSCSRVHIGCLRSSYLLVYSRVPLYNVT